MGDIKWIKLSTGIFDNRKIKQIETLPDGDTIIVIWVKLLCLAGTINDCGYIYLTKEIPYTEQMLASQFSRPLSTIQLALQTFEQFGMIEVIDNILMISNWEKYQNIVGMEKIREQTRIRVANHRQKQKQLECNVTCNATVTQCNATDKNKNKNKKEDIDIEKDIDIKNKSKNYSNTIAQNDLKNRSVPAVITLTLNDKTEYPIYQNDIDNWKELYQAVDILNELRKMKGWIEANPSRRKTKTGIKRFINSWLSKEQDKGYKYNSEIGKEKTRITKFDV